MRSLTETPNVAQPAPSPKMRISAPVPRNLQSSECPLGLSTASTSLNIFNLLLLCFVTGLSSWALHDLAQLFCL